MPSFTDLADLAAARVGGRALAANDEFFAPKENLLKPGRGDVHPGQVHGPRQVDGRLGDAPAAHARPRLVRRPPGHARASSAASTSTPTTSSATSPRPAPLDACDRGEVRTRRCWARGPHGREMLPPSRLQGGSQNLFPIAADRGASPTCASTSIPTAAWRGCACYGEVEPDWRRSRRAKRLSTSRRSRTAALVLGASDMHFGSKDNLIMPGPRGRTWATAGRRGGGAAGPRLGHPAARRARARSSGSRSTPTTSRATIPDSCSLEGCRRRRARLELLASESPGWQELLPQTRLRPHQRHFCGRELRARGPFSSRTLPHLSRWRREPPAHPWTRSRVSMTRCPRPKAAPSCLRCCGSLRWVERCARPPPLRATASVALRRGRGALVRPRRGRLARGLRPPPARSATATLCAPGSPRPRVGERRAGGRPRPPRNVLAPSPQGTRPTRRASATSSSSARPARAPRRCWPCCAQRLAQRSPGRELRIAAGEQAKITRLRLEKLLAEDA